MTRRTEPKSEVFQIKSKLKSKHKTGSDSSVDDTTAEEISVGFGMEKRVREREKMLTASQSVCSMYIRSYMVYIAFTYKLPHTHTHPALVRVRTSDADV